MTDWSVMLPYQLIHSVGGSESLWQLQARDSPDLGIRSGVNQNVGQFLYAVPHLAPVQTLLVSCLMDRRDVIWVLSVFNSRTMIQRSCSTTFDVELYSFLIIDQDSLSKFRRYSLPPSSVEAAAL